MTKKFDQFYNVLMEKGLHASPYNISDKFDLSFIGKGEGNRSFGWGLYFAENPKVTDEYIELFKDRNNKEGYLYEVDIDVKSDELLDWDVSIDEQSPYIKDKIKDAVEYLRKYTWKQFSDGIGRVIDPYGNTSKDIIAFSEKQLKEVQYGKGKDFYEWLANYSSEKDASLGLLNQGIKGIKYLDYISRIKGKGTRNFVIFDASLIHIKNKKKVFNSDLARETTKKFDDFRKILVESMQIQRRGVHPYDYEMFPDINEQELKKGLWIHDWNLKDLQRFKKMLGMADRLGVYVFAQAYPYNSSEKDFNKDTERLLQMYKKTRLE